ncbi:hypothetical protein EEL31_10585 [Brevibacillus laterosporus]|nr:hypothetical protein EEL31_10585 [Brevibacillus laterosporus]
MCNFNFHIENDNLFLEIQNRDSISYKEQFTISQENKRLYELANKLTKLKLQFTPTKISISGESWFENVLNKLFRPFSINRTNF